MEEFSAALLAAWTAIVGAVLPVVVGLIRKIGDSAGTWTRRGKQVLALLAATVSGLITTGVASGWDLAGETWTAVVAVATGIWVVAQTAYHNFWKSATTIVSGGADNVTLGPDGRVVRERFDEGYNPGDVGYSGVGDSGQV